MAVTLDAGHRDEGLIWLDPVQTGQPGTHVLIVGVGRFHANSGLTRLTSPAPTACQLADWCMATGGFRNLVRSLASLSLLLSEDEDGALSQIAGGPVPRAGFAAMKAAMAGLKARSEAHPGNQMILYLASHGMGVGDRTGRVFEDHRATDSRGAGMTDTDQMVRAP
jgi:hypothetical protein